MSVDPTKRFSTRVPFYVRSRPGYPPAMLEFFRSALSLNPEHVIADIGSGTGILSELFLQNGNTVFCVEPNAEMREAADVQLKVYDRYHPINGTAEASGLPDHSVDFVTAGQAFHWFDPVKASAECERIIKPGGPVALVWNERRAIDAGFNAAYDRFIDQFTRDRATAAVRGGSFGTEPAIRQFFGDRGYRVETFDNHQTLDWLGLLDRVYSSSYLPLPSDANDAAMTAELRTLFDQFATDDMIRIEYQTRLYYGRFRVS